MAVGLDANESAAPATPAPAHPAVGGVASDESLAADAALDRGNAFDTLARRYQVPLLRFLLRSTRDPHDAEDGLQETFRRLFAARRRYDPAKRFRPWAFAVARRVAIDLANERQARRLRLRPLDDDTPAPAAPADDGDRTLLWDLARRTLCQEQVQALWLFHVEQMPAADIAVVLGRSWVGVKTLLVRARRRLRGVVLAHERRQTDWRTR